MAGLVCQCSDTMMASCDVTGSGDGLSALLGCVALVVWMARSQGCCDGYESSDGEELGETAKSMYT